MSEPARNEAIKRRLEVGMTVTYFCGDKNALVEATIVGIRKTRATVVNTQDGSRWNISFHLINLDGVDIGIAPQKCSGALDRNSLKVGDYVGWHSRHGCDLYGVVEKLNPKKALIQLGSGECWTVPYSLLFPVMEGVAGAQSNALFCMEGEVIREK